MGQNSTSVAYSFGQMGSAYSDVAQTIIPPQNHVIVAIQFLDDNTPTIMEPERLDTAGPNFPYIASGANTDLDADSNDFNANGVVTLDLTDNAGSNINPVVLSGGANAKVKPGQFVLLVNDTAETDGDPLITLDGQTPAPVYHGPNARGVKVKSVDGANITLERHLTNGSPAFEGLSPDSQSLIFLDEYHGAGGIIADGQVYPKGITIYGRWTAFRPSASGVICYFGK